MEDDTICPECSRDCYGKRPGRFCLECGWKESSTLATHDFTHSKQVGHRRSLDDMLGDVKSMSWETIHFTIKSIFNCLVPAPFRLSSALYSMSNFSNEDVEDLKRAIQILVEEISTRPERSCLADIELNHMMQTYRRLQARQIEAGNLRVEHEASANIPPISARRKLID